MSIFRAARRATLAAAASTALAALAGCARAKPPAAPAPDPAAAIGSWDDARVRGVDFRAIGQEPGWVLDLDVGGELLFLGDYGRTRVAAATPTPARGDGGATTYRVTAEGEEMRVEIVPGDCRDVMSGAAYPYTVTVRRGGRELRGCGRMLASGAIEGVYWRLVELGGQSVVPVPAEREAHLVVDADGARVAGSTGCNRFSGPVTREGDRVRFGPLVSTKVACAEPALGRQELAFVRGLEAVDAARVEGDALVLLAGGSEVARFAAVRLR